MPARGLRHSVFDRLRRLPYPFLLYNPGFGNGWGRTDADCGLRIANCGFESGKSYAVMGAAPFLVLTAKGGRATETHLDGAGSTTAAYIKRGTPLEALGELLAGHRARGGNGRMTCCAAGLLSYDLVRTMERIPCRTPPTAWPDLVVGFYDSVMVVDGGAAHLAHPPGPVPARGRLLLDALSECERTTRNHRPSIQNPKSEIQNPKSCWNMDRERYLSAVAAAKDYIGRGDIYQVNLSRRLEVRVGKRYDSYDYFRRVCAVNPAPHSAYMAWPGGALASASPERFLRVTGGRIETRPIKGTRPRGRTAGDDAARAGELLRSSKDMAEHVMIVDLERNDLGRVCRFGTVKVARLVEHERFAAVHHLTSTVTGRLRPRVTPDAVLAATFPGGSITGAPKVRSMEIIEELEPTRRGPYTGSMGFIGFGGEMEFSILIRSVAFRDGAAHMQVGGGIVADSVPEDEFLETGHKARRLVEPLLGRNIRPLGNSLL